MAVQPELARRSQHKAFGRMVAVWWRADAGGVRTDKRVREKSSQDLHVAREPSSPGVIPSPPARCAAHGLPRTKGEHRASALHAYALKLKTSGLFPGGLSSRDIACRMKCVFLCQCVRQQIAPAGGGQHHQQPPASCMLPGLRPPSWKEAV